MNINFFLRRAVAVCHKFGEVSFVLKYFLDVSFDFLFSCLGMWCLISIFFKFPKSVVTAFWFDSIVVPKDTWCDFNLVKFVTLVLWSNKLLVLENIPWGLEKNVDFGAVGWNVLYLSVILVFFYGFLIFWGMIFLLFKVGWWSPFLLVCCYLPLQLCCSGVKIFDTQLYLLNKSTQLSLCSDFPCILWQFLTQSLFYLVKI